jgi:lipopolysaccharide/colanic/teichoic acid biosynthesis glycosyltransferase
MMKRSFDVCVAVLLLGAGLAVLIVTWILVRCFLGAPAFFSQIRPGVHGKPFRMIKFRTMTNARDQSGELLPNEQRSTRFGNFLRSSSLDELPELWNVLKGDMSLVGPRPLLMEYLPFYSLEQNRRHEVRPGITGWAQVNGRNAISWEQKLELDVWYVNNRTFWLDLKILWMTVWKVIRRNDIAPDGKFTVERFDVYVKSKQAMNGES